MRSRSCNQTVVAYVPQGRHTAAAMISQGSGLRIIGGHLRRSDKGIVKVRYQVRLNVTLASSAHWSAKRIKSDTMRRIT